MAEADDEIWKHVQRVSRMERTLLGLIVRDLLARAGDEGRKAVAALLDEHASPTFLSGLDEDTAVATLGAVRNLRASLLTASGDVANSSM